MRIDPFGISHRTSDELCSLLYKDPQVNLHDVKVDDPEEFNRSIKSLFSDYKPLEKYKPLSISIEDFDSQNQSNWYMPNNYKTLDIDKWLLEQCQTAGETRRIKKELVLFRDRNLIDLLRFMKYFVDTMRENNIIWGIGRGSSTASYALFLLGVHKINSIEYDLPIEEFLK